MTTVAIACATGVYALLFSGLRGDESTRCKVGVARIERTNAQGQKRCEQETDDGKSPLAGFHDSTPLPHDPKKVGTGFSKRPCSTKNLERQPIQFEAIAL
jgi:hypothetical protein